MRISDWSSDGCSSDLNCFYPIMVKDGAIVGFGDVCPDEFHPKQTEVIDGISYVYPIDKAGVERKWRYARQSVRSEEHTSELQSLMRISYAVFCLKKKNTMNYTKQHIKSI